MAEGLIKRIGRIISASSNAFVDSIENAAPQLVMEESIREIDAAISDVREQLGKIEAAKYLSSKSLNRENTKHSELQSHIQIALDAARDDLAEAAISKQMDIESLLPVLEKSIADDENEISELNSYISALQAKKREMQETLKEFIKTQGHLSEDSNSAGTSPNRNIAEQVENANSAFNRILEKSGVPVADSNGNESKLAELEELARSNRIKERLAKAKSGVNV